MKTPKITIKKSLAPIAVLGAFQLLSYFPAQSMISEPIGESPMLMQYDKGDKAFTTKIFFKYAESNESAEPSVRSRKLINYYGG